MTAQVIFLNTNYYPGHEERTRLRTLQDFINSSRAGLMNRIITYSPPFKAVAIQKHHNEFRAHIKLIVNEAGPELIYESPA